MNKKIISLILICMIVLSFAGCGGNKDKNVLEETAVNVTVSEAVKGNITKTENYTGEIKAVSVASVSSKVSANVKRIHVDVGDYVKAGDVIMTLDSKQYDLAQSQAQAAYNSAVAAKNSAVAAKESAVAMRKSATAAKEGADAAKQSAVAAKTGAEASYNNVTGGSLEQSKVSMNQAVSNAQSAYDTALENYNRQKALYDIGAISQVAFDSAETSLNNAKVALEAAKANADLNESVVVPQTEASANAGVSQAEAGISQAEAGISQAEAGISQADAGISQAEAGVRQAEAGVNQAKVAVDIAKENVANCTIKAPISGYISSKNFNIGQMAAPGVEAFSIKDTASLDVEINVTESVIANISKGTKATVSIKSAKLEGIKGKVTAVGETKNEATGMFTVKVSIPNKNKKIKIGMLADVTLSTERAKKVLTVDYDSLISKNDKYYVYVARNNVAVKKEVEVGITDGKKAEIISGIKAGDMVILEGKDFLSDKNNKIRIVD